MNHPIEQRNQDDIYIGICFAMVKLKDFQVKGCRLLCNSCTQESKPYTLIKPFLLLCSDFIQICSQFFCSDGEQFENDSALDSDSEHVPHVFGHIFSILVLPIKSTFDESKQNSLNLSHWLLGFSL